MEFKLLNTFRGILVESIHDLPDFSGAKNLYLDVETTSFRDTVSGVSPYLGGRICGIACTVDASDTIWYIPYRHKHERWNLNPTIVQKWIKHLEGIPNWINHNIKFDYHFMHWDGLRYPGNLIDTLTLAKCHDTDRFTWGLKQLCREWIDFPMEEEEEVSAYLKGEKSKDYGIVPADILGRYAMMDVAGNRELFKYLVKNRPDDLKGIWKTEIDLTKVLWTAEHEGLLVDIPETKRRLVKSLRELIDIEGELYDIAGREYADSPKCNYDYIVSYCGLPVLMFNAPTETQPEGGPCFDKDAMAKYTIHPKVVQNTSVKRVIDLIIRHRALSQFKSLFLESYINYADENNRVHCDYNQVIRTGRMSCRSPNFQQVNPEARELIHPPPGHVFISADASQIEFRIIVHYIKDEDAIRAYNEDPNTDFHSWVAELCHVKRGPAKNLNFAMGYGAGKNKVVSMLSGNPDVMAEIGEEMKALDLPRGMNENTFYTHLCKRRAQDIYATYHERLPGIKTLSNVAAKNCRVRGYTFNLFGRRRHLPPRFSHKAFNTVVQGCAMDFIKDRMVATSPVYSSWARENGIKLVANVHDEILYTAPEEVIEERGDALFQELKEQLEEQRVKFRIPLTWDIDKGKTWRIAAGK